MNRQTHHLTRHVVRAARSGDLDFDPLLVRLLDHLEEVCPECSREIGAEREDEIPPSAYGGSVGRVLRNPRVRRAREDTEERTRAVPTLVETLRGLSTEQRLLLVRNLPERFVHPSLVEAMIAESRACLPGYPAGALAWAETAAGVAALYPEPSRPQEVHAIAYKGNAYRASRDFEGSRRLLRQAQELADRYQVDDVDVHADIHSFLGSLWTDFRHLGDAARHLDEAAELNQLVNDEEAVARVCIQLANLRGYQGDFERALEVNQNLVELLEPSTSPLLYMAVRYNFALTLTMIGDREAARDALEEDEDLFRKHTDPHLTVRRVWLRNCLGS